MSDLLVPEIFNRKLADYLLWYNTKRVHFAFQNKLSPMQSMLSLPINQLPEKRKITALEVTCSELRIRYGARAIKDGH